MRGSQSAGGLPTLSPVSYTHLDVYKRQVFRRLVVIDAHRYRSRTKTLLSLCKAALIAAVYAHGQIRPADDLLILGEVASVEKGKICRHLIPVSYTHLDVYKRQVFLYSFDQTHGYTRNRPLDRYAGIHQRQTRTACRPHGGGSVGRQYFRYYADSVRKFFR